MSFKIDGNGDIFVGSTLIASLASDGIRGAKPATDPFGLTTLSQLNAAVSNGTPLSLVAAFAGTAAPAGWTICDGRALSRTDYAELFALIGTTYGAGNGSTTFNIPDLRGEFIRGWDAGRGADAGRILGSWQRGSLLMGEDYQNTVEVPELGADHAKWAWDNPRASWVPNLFGSVGARAGGAGGQFAASGAGPDSPDYQFHMGVSRPRNVAMLLCIRSHFVAVSADAPTVLQPPVRSWKSILAGRALGGTYSNLTGNEIKVSVSISSNVGSAAGTRPRFAVFVDNERVLVQQIGDLNGSNFADATENVSFEVPSGSNYSVRHLDGTNTLVVVEWSELRTW